MKQSRHTHTHTHTLEDIGVGSNFLDRIQNAQTTKLKVNR
jgi:hypothetical protein